MNCWKRRMITRLFKPSKNQLSSCVQLCPRNALKVLDCLLLLTPLARFASGGCNWFARNGNDILHHGSHSHIRVAWPFRFRWLFSHSQTLRNQRRLENPIFKVAHYQLPGGFAGPSCSTVEWVLAFRHPKVALAFSEFCRFGCRSVTRPRCPLPAASRVNSGPFAQPCSLGDQCCSQCRRSAV